MKAVEQPLIPNDRPEQVTVYGEELLAWHERAKAGEVHIYKMVRGKHNSQYTIFLMWLDGRKLYQCGEKPETNLSTPQCSTGSTESRPFPATAGKIMESAGHLRNRNAAAGSGGTVEKPNATDGKRQFGNATSLDLFS